MKTVEKTPTIHQRTKQMLRFAGLFAPVIIFIYGVLCYVGMVHDEAFTANAAFYGIGIAWIVLGIYQFLTPPRTQNQLLFMLGSYHLLALGFMIFVGGLSAPLVCLWLLLMLTAFIYFGDKGFTLSTLFLLAACLFAIIVNNAHPSTAFATLLYFVLTLFVSYSLCTIYENQTIDQNELRKSQQGEINQRNQLLTVINNFTDAVLTTDPDGVVQLYNAATLDLLNTNAALTGQTVDHVMSLATENNKPFKLLHQFRTAKSVQVHDDLHITVSGETLQLNVTLSPIHEMNSRVDTSNDIAGFIVIVRDITKQKSLDEEKDEFISVVSHELRTPIAIAEGSLSNLQLMMARNMPKPTLEENVKMSHEQIMFLASMVNDLSTLSRAERGIADAPELLTVNSLMHELYGEYAPKAQAKQLAFNLDLDPNVGDIFASKLYVHELLQNFITNAIKYTKTGEITISARRENGNIRFSVKDTGMGMTKSDQAHIYERFWRSEDYRTRETSGTGLGLYVAHKLSKKLGTVVELKSRLNHGSTFSFILPEKK